MDSKQSPTNLGMSFFGGGRAGEVVNCLIVFPTILILTINFYYHSMDFFPHFRWLGAHHVTCK